MNIAMILFTPLRPGTEKPRCWVQALQLAEGMRHQTMLVSEKTTLSCTVTHLSCATTGLCCLAAFCFVFPMKVIFRRSC